MKSHVESGVLYHNICSKSLTLDFLSRMSICEIPLIYKNDFMGTPYSYDIINKIRQVEVSELEGTVDMFFIYLNRIIESISKRWYHK